MADTKTCKMYLGDTLISGSQIYEYDQTQTLVKRFIDEVTYNPSDYTTSQITNYAPSVADTNNTYPSGVNINGNTYYNHIPNKYSAILLKDNQSAVVKPTHFLRQIKCATSNVRDLGGWTCDGGTVKYGKLFRGGEFQEADLDIFLNQLGIKHELNLRGLAEANGEPSVLRDYVGFTCPTNYVWHSISDTTTWKEIFRCIFDCVAESKPLFFHCSAGADRTGTVACMIEAILGMSQSDIDKEYELTCFAYGTGTDANARRRNESDWQGQINAITSLTVGTTFRDKVINWLATMGFTADEINAFRVAMIDGTPDTISLNIGTHTITNTLSNATNSNGQTSVAKYQPYESEISVQEGYVIENIKVMMGGTDITSSVFKGTKTNLKRAITKNTTNCSISGKKAVIDGQDFVATVTADDGYTLDGGTITITMGGVDMSTYYSDGKIAIPNVTGDIVITANAVASAPSYTNQIPISIDSDGTIFNGKGYKESSRINSSGDVATLSGFIATGFIPVKTGDVFEFENSYIKPSHSSAASCQICYYKSDFGKSTSFTMNNVTAKDGVEIDSDGNVTKWTCDNTSTSIAYIRFTLTASDNPIITKNEPIE